MDRITVQYGIQQQHETTRTNVMTGVETCQRFTMQMGMCDLPVRLLEFKARL